MYYLKFTKFIMYFSGNKSCFCDSYIKYLILWIKKQL